MKVSSKKSPFSTSLPKKLIRIITVATIITGGFIASPAHATDGTLDETFGTLGKVTTSISIAGVDGDAASMAVQADGKILVAGYAEMTGDYSTYNFALVRYNTNGTLDEDFDGDTGTGNGKVTTDISGVDFGFSVAIQQDGKILVAGYTSIGGSDDFALVRYNTNGTLDTSFDSDGIVTTNLGGNGYGYSVAIQQDGKILVAGDTGGDFALVRYNTNGTLDTSFDGVTGTGNGIVTTNLGGNDYGNSVAIQPDGKILVTGRTDNLIALVRYNDDGTLDTSFEGVTGTGNGIVKTLIGGSAAGNSVAIQQDGKILVAGQTQINGSTDYALVRYNTNGTLDNSFDTDGKVTAHLGGIDRGHSVAIQQDGKILVVGYTENRFGLLRVNSDGTRDTSFGSAGIVFTAFVGSAARSVAIQPDGKILVAGYSYTDPFSFAVARYTTTLLAVTLSATSPTSSSATITFTLTGTETLDCATLSTVAGDDFNVTNISAIDSITQTSPTECTISATSSATSDGVPVTSTLATSSSFSVGFLHGNTRSTVSGASQSVIVTLPESAPTATEPAPTTTVEPPATAPTTTVEPPATAPTTTVEPPTAVVATTIASPVVASVKKFDSLPETGSNTSTSAIFGFLLVLAGFVLAGRRRMVKDI
jgi:uncharacterized delta-60 repeat protein/LPXTG-motif cell wall-anchored protein